MSDNNENDKYLIEAQGLSTEALVEQEKRLAAIKVEVAWRKRNQARIDAGIVARAEAKDDTTKDWIEGLRKEVIGELRKAESLKRIVGESAPKKVVEATDSKADQRPVQAAPQVPQGGQQDTAPQAGVTPQNMGGRP